MTDPRAEVTGVDAAAGGARRGRAQGRKSAGLHRALADLDTGLAELTDSFVFGSVWGRDGLTHRERMLVAISALAAQGRTAMLRNYLHGWLQDTGDPAPVQEALVMMSVYAGFPAAVTALLEWRDVQAKENDHPQEETPVPTEKNAEIIRNLYAAVVAGDVEATLAKLSQDVRLIESKNLAYGGTHVGLEQFTSVLGAVAGALRLSELKVHKLVADDDQVVAFVHVPVADGSGEILEIVEWWVVRDGLVVEVQPFYGDQDLLARAVTASAQNA